jgi:hypothetical protein
MRSYHDLYAIAFFEEGFEGANVGTGRIADDQTSSEVNDLRPILYHFFSGVFNVAAWTAITGRVTDQFYFGVGVYAESSLSLFHCPQTFPSCTTSVTIANDYSYLRVGTHLASFIV